MSALSYAVLVAAFLSVPLALAFNLLLFGVLAPHAEGFSSMRVLGLGVTVAIGSVVVTSLVPLLLVAWTLILCGIARLRGAALRFDATIRATCYAASSLAIPVVGLPLAILQELWMVRFLLAGTSVER